MELNEATQIIARMSDALKRIKEEADSSSSRKDLLEKHIDSHKKQIEALKNELNAYKIKAKLWNTISINQSIKICSECNGVGQDATVYSDDHGNGGVDEFFCETCKGLGYLQSY